MPLSRGDKLGPYDILSALGAGGMGEVYKAWDTRLSRFVAIKVLKSDVVSDVNRKQRFILEAKAASALSHPNIVTVYDIVQQGGTDCLVMEFISGKTLDALIPRQGLRINEALRIAVQIAEGLRRAHSAGIIHRDIKPANIIVPEDGPVKILDFGLAKLTEATTPNADLPTLTQHSETEDGRIMGTIAYMSPEQAEGRRVDVRTDVFSFGALLYEMCSGRRAFNGDSKHSTISSILKDEPKPLENIPTDLDKIIRRCLRKDPAKRFQHMDDVKITLDEIREDSEAGRLAEPTTVQAHPQRRWPLVTAAVVAVLGGTAYWLNWTIPAKQQESVMTQLTRDPGLTYMPALSPDGKMLAFSSNRSGEGRFDIWVQQMAGGPAIRLTNGPGDNLRPTFTPDGTRIAFTSFADRTLSSVPALGGDPTVISRAFYERPHYAPDGSQLAVSSYQGIGMDGFDYLLPATGGAPRKIETGFGDGEFTAWSPDAKTILFREIVSKLFPVVRKEIYAIPTDGGTAVSTDLVQAFRARGVELFGVRWLSGRLVAAGKAGDVGVIEEFHLQKDTWRLDGSPRQLLSIPGAFIEISAADSGPIVFSSIQSSVDIWSIRMDANTGKVRGKPENLTNDAAIEREPTLSADGKRMVFVSDRTGRSEVWLRDLDTSKDTQLTTTVETEFRARISPDGTKVAYEVRGQPNYILVRQVDTSEPVPVCRNCSNPRWTLDSEQVTFYSGNPVLYQSLHLRTGARTDIVSHRKHPVTTVKISPDGNWISFYLPLPSGHTQVYISPLKDGRAAPEAEWIRVSDGKSWIITPSWSPDGNLLYLVQHGIGTEHEIVAQPLDPRTKRPKGGLIPVFRPNPEQRFPAEGVMGLSLSADRLVLEMYESKGNLWKLEQK